MRDRVSYGPVPGSELLQSSTPKSIKIGPIGPSSRIKKLWNVLEFGTNLLIFYLEKLATGPINIIF